MNKVVDTLGWDTVFAANYSTVNEAIENEQTYPTNFNYVDKELGMTIKGIWKSWRLIPGGSGGSVKMECIIESGTVEGFQQPVGDLSSSCLIIRVRLSALESDKHAFNDSTGKVGTGQAMILKINTHSTAENVAVEVSQDSKYPNVKSVLFQDLLGGIFDKYFNEHISEFNHVFSIMMINVEAANDDFAWLKPSDFSYAVGGPEEGSIDEHVFGVLTMTDGENISPKQQQAIDISCLQNLPMGANSAFVISAEKVVQHMLLGGAIATIQGSKKEDFKINDDGISITNVNDIVWDKFEIGNGKVIEPMLNKGSFNMSMQNDHILLEIIGAHYQQSLGLTVKMNLTQKFAYQTIQREDGKYVFVPDTSKYSKPDANATVEAAEWLKDVQIGLEIVSMLALVAFGASAVAKTVSEGAAITTEGSEIAFYLNTEEIGSESLIELDELAAETIGNPIKKGGAAAVSKIKFATGFISTMAGIGSLEISVAKDIASKIAAKDYNNIPAFNDFAYNCLGAMKWPGMKDAELISADIRQSLVIATKLDTN